MGSVSTIQFWSCSFICSTELGPLNIREFVLHGRRTFQIKSRFSHIHQLLSATRFNNGENLIRFMVFTFFGCLFGSYMCALESRLDENYQDSSRSEHHLTPVNYWLLSVKIMAVVTL